MTVGTGGGEVLKFVKCLHILLFLNRRYIYIYLFLRMGVRELGRGCGRHNCMILNIKTCFDKKVTLLDLVL